jgi:hypothetical protein
MPSVEIAPGLWLDEYDDGFYMMVEKGKASVFIRRGVPPKDAPASVTASPRPTPVNLGSAPFQVRASGDTGQEVVSAEGRVVARTTDPAAGELICKLLNVYKKVKG